MLSAEQNERLTRVGPGTPMGELLRRYWHPFASVTDLKDKWTKRVRLLGEDLVLFRDRQGRFGLVEERCPHRGASLAYGLPTEEGLRCPYHGWKFDVAGRCLEMPNDLSTPDAVEARAARDKSRYNARAYRVEEMGGMFFAYLGPEPAPLLPRFDGFVIDGAIRTLGRTVVPCNFLQIMENSSDPVHTEWLHGHLQEFIEGNETPKYAISHRHVRIGFDEFEFGMIKRRLLEGQSEDCDDWRIGHPIVFPTMLSVGNGDPSTWRMYQFQIRTPMDDTHTLHLWYMAFVPPPDVEVPEHLLNGFTTYHVPFQHPNGDFILDMVDAQDILAWVTQGPIADRTREKLGPTDEGVVKFRRMLLREIEKVERGEDPIGTLRDPSRNTMIELPVEKDKDMFMDGFVSIINRLHTRYTPIKDDLIKVFSSTGKPKSGSRVSLEAAK